MGEVARDLRVVPDVSEDPEDPALAGMESVDGKSIDEPTEMSRLLEAFRASLAELGIKRGASFGVRNVDGETRIVRLSSEGEVVGVMPPHLGVQMPAPKAPILRIV